MNKTIVEWALMDAKDQVLGRFCTAVAASLLGKDRIFSHRPDLLFQRHVVVVNAEKIYVSGNKVEAKQYIRHSGYPGGLKVVSLKQMQAEKPEEIIVHAVRGMIPHNRYGHKVMTRLHVYAGEEHPHPMKKGQS